MAGLSERDLIKRCRRGDDRAFAQLVDHYKNMVLTIIDRMILDKSLLEDLAQEVFLRVYKGLPQFRGRSKLSTWIYRITYNVCLAEIGSTDNRPNVLPLDSTSGEEATWRLAGTQEDAETWLAKLELKEAIGRFLDRLPPQYRMVIALYYLEGTSYREIAEIMKLPMGTVKTYLHRAKKYLRNMIVEEGGKEWIARTA